MNDKHGTELDLRKSLHSTSTSNSFLDVIHSRFKAKVHGLDGCIFLTETRMTELQFLELDMTLSLTLPPASLSAGY